LVSATLTDQDFASANDQTCRYETESRALWAGSGAGLESGHDSSVNEAKELQRNMGDGGSRPVLSGL